MLEDQTIEQQLENDLIFKKIIQEHVKLKYFQAINNIRTMLISQDLMDSTPKVTSKEGFVEKTNNEVVSEKEILSLYNQYLALMNESTTRLFLSVYFQLYNNSITSKNT